MLKLNFWMRLDLDSSLHVSPADQEAGVCRVGTLINLKDGFRFRTIWSQPEKFIGLILQVYTYLYVLLP